MPIDSASKRRAALDYEEPWAEAIPLPDGSIEKADRYSMLWNYPIWVNYYPGCATVLTWLYHTATVLTSLVHTATVKTATCALDQAVVTPNWYLFRDLFSTNIGAGLLNNTPATPGAGNRAATDTEGVGLISPPFLFLGEQATATWGDQVVKWPVIARVTGRCMAAVVVPRRPSVEVALGLATSAPTGDPRTNGAGVFFDASTYGAIAANKAYLTSFRGARPVQQLMVVALSTVGSVVLVSAPDTLSGLNQSDPIGIPKYPLARVWWIDDDATASLIPYISSAAVPPEVGTQLFDLRVVDVATWTTDDYLAAFVDRFGRADSNTALGNSWSDDSGVWGISSGKAYQVSGTGRSIASHATSLTDGNGLWHWQVTMPNGQIECLLRYKDVDNYVSLAFVAGSLVQLYKRVAGSNSVIYQTGADAPTAGNTYSVDVLTCGNQYNIFVNGKTNGEWQTDAGSSLLTETMIGMATWSNPSGEEFDNVCAYPLTVTLPATLQLGTVPTVYNPGATLASDTFTDTDATALEDHTPTAGPAWTEELGTWTIQSNAASAAGTDGLFATQDLGTTDAEIEVDIITPGSGHTFYAGVTFRREDINNFFYARIFMNPSQPASDEVELWRIIGGTSETVVIYNLGDYYATSSTYNLRVQCKGHWILLWLDDNLIMTYYTEAGDPAGTLFGVYRDGTDAGCVLDNWVAKAL